MKYIKNFENNNKYSHDDFIDAINMYDIKLVKKIIDTGIDLEIQDTDGNTGLMVASYENRIDIVKILIEAGANIEARNYTNGTALLLASYNNRIEIVKMLIEAGADWNAINIHGRDFLDYYDEVGLRAKIIELYPEQYKDYLMKKDIEKYNL